MAKGFAVGFNIAEAKNLVVELGEAWQSLGTYIADSWDTVGGANGVIRKHWVGEDAQDFEKKLGERLNELYISSRNLVYNCGENLQQLATDWHNFQLSNMLTGTGGSGEYGTGEVDLQVSTAIGTINGDNLITFASWAIGEDEDRGLQSVDSAATIKDEISKFVTSVKDKVDSLFEEVESTISKAFMGDQSTSIKTYIDAVGAAVGELNVAVKDIYDALDQLAGTNYSGDAGMTGSVNSSFNAAPAEVESALSDATGSSRWSA